MLTLDDLTFRIGPRVLLENAGANLPSGARVGLVGRNGCGKSTLFKLILGELTAESGAILRPRGQRIGHVAQEAPGGPTALIDFVLAADTERTALLAAAEAATDPGEIAELQMRLADTGAHAAPSRAAGILAGLGFSHADQARPCSDFSGGWRMRVALAAMLFLEPELLLLDEPTNYLDLEGALWLKSHLKRYPHTLLVISHDRDFLDEVCDHILHLDRGRLELYRGDYTTFRRVQAEKRALAVKEADKVAAERAHLQAFVDRFKAKASKAKQAQARVKRLEKLGPVATFAGEEGTYLHLPDPEKTLPPPIVRLDHASAGYDGRAVLAGLTLSIDADDRIGLLGPNGNGKSTLVKLVSGRLDPMAGEVTRDSRLKIAYFAQHQLDELDAGATPALLVRRRRPEAGEAEIRAGAARFGFSGERADTPIVKLSGGEKARLLLGLAAMDGPHLLILDEPTNHLDIPMREALIEALAAYKGAVILVSHDRTLLDAASDRLWLVADGKVRAFEGDLDDYEATILGEREEHPVRRPAPTADPRRLAAEKRQSLKPLRERAKSLEAALERFQGLLARADEALARPDLFAKAPERAAQIARDRAALAERLAETEEEWLAVMSEIEAAGA